MEKGICIILISIFLSNGKIYFIIPRSKGYSPISGYYKTLVNVYVDLVVFTPIAGTS